MEEVLSTQYSSQAEQAVLGSMLIDSECVRDVVTFLRKDDFYLETNQKVYAAIYSMFTYSEPIDGVTVFAKMEENGDATPETKKYLVDLMEITPTSANAMEYARIVKEKATMRSLSGIAQKVEESVSVGGRTSKEILEEAEQMLYSMRSGKAAEGMVHLSSALQDTMIHLGEITRSGGKLPGISTGIPTLDKKINGLNKSDFILLAARPAMGKTALALNIATNAAKNSGKTVAIFSLEMSVEQLVCRLLASEALVDNHKLKTGDLNDADWSKIAEASVNMSTLNIEISDDPMQTVADMKAKCRRIENLGLVVIDYLQLMTSAGGKPTSGENRQQVVSNISRMLKIMAKDLQVPVLCLSQLSRANEKREDKHPLLSDLRESGSIEQDADIVMFIYREDYYNREGQPTNTAELTIAKNRHGETGRIELRWVPECTTFYELETRHSDYDE